MDKKPGDNVQYDEENDVLYVLLSEREVFKTQVLDDLRLVDYDDREEPVGIEFVSAGDGLDLTNAPVPV